MLYVTGDTHGMYAERFEREILPYAAAWTKDDVLLIAGDFGFVFQPKPSEAEEEALAKLSQLPFTVAFIDGNHECFPRLGGYPPEYWMGGTVHRLAPNIVHLLRGECYQIGGKSVLCMGGGYSLDKALRRPGVSWWAEEMPGLAEYAKCRRSMERLHHQVDIVLTHTAPTSVIYRLGWTLSPEAMLNDFLEEMRRSLTYGHWYFGHLHIDQDFGDGMMGLMHDVRNVETGELLSP